MLRSILPIALILAFMLTLSGAAWSQDFILQSSDPEVVALSQQNQDVINVFSDTNGDGVYDTVEIGDRTITGNIRVGDAEGFQYQDERYIAIYPASYSGLPAMGESALLGFIHYFDTENLSTYLAIVAEQSPNDETTNGLAVYFYDSAGLRVGAPTTMFMEKARLRILPIYQEWVQMSKDFGIGSNPTNSQYFVFAKDLGLTDHILIVMYQLYQR